MPSSGSTTGTPITPSGASSGNARAFPLTCLPLDTYARILGIHPAHFWGLASNSVFKIQSQCSDLWRKYSWQAGDRVSREDVAQAIVDAEDEIASVLGFYPCPRWFAKEIHPYPRSYYREAYDFGYNVRGQYKSIKANWGKFIAAGQRATTLIGTATTSDGSLAYSDPDGDGFAELATITLTTTLTEACEIKAYPANYSGQQEWEIKPSRSKSISGGSVTMTFDAWLLVDPDLYEVFPTDGNVAALDPTDGNTFLSSVEVYREYTDFTATSAEFSWEPDVSSLAISFCTSCGGTGCPACSHTIQSGCLHVRDVDTGLVVPVPATYDSDNTQWNKADWTECRAPDTAKLWYYAGDLSDKYLSGRSCNPLSDFFAHPIAWMATARLERDFCSCANLTALQEYYRTDLARVDDTASYTFTPELLENPFGTRRGEVMAWQRIEKLAPIIAEVALA